MMIFRYHMVDGRSFDEAVPKEVEALSLAEVREFVARVVCPPVKAKELSRLEPAFHILTLDGNAHLIITHNLVDVEIMVAVDPAQPNGHAWGCSHTAAWPSKDCTQAHPYALQSSAAPKVQVHNGPGERGEHPRGGYVPDSTEPGPGHLRLAASNGDQVSRRSHGGPFGGHTFT